MSSDGGAPWPVEDVASTTGSATLVPASGGALASLAYSGASLAEESVAPEPAADTSSTTGSATIMPASGGALASLAHGGASSLSSWALVGPGSGAGSESSAAVHSMAPSAASSLEHVRQMAIVSSRLHSVPEGRPISTESLPSSSALAHASREVQACLDFCKEVGKEDLQLGEAAEPESGDPGVAPP